jgi:hypothetical protein
VKDSHGAVHKRLNSLESASGAADLNVSPQQLCTSSRLAEPAVEFVNQAGSVSTSVVWRGDFPLVRQGAGELLTSKVLSERGKNRGADEF